MFYRLQMKMKMNILRKTKMKLVLNMKKIGKRVLLQAQMNLFTPCYHFQLG